MACVLDRIEAYSSPSLMRGLQCMTEVLISSAALEAMDRRIDEAVRKALEQYDLKPKPKVAPAALDSWEAAEYLGIGRSTLYEILALMAVSFTIGKRRLWRVADLDAWLRQQEASPAVNSDEAAAK